jgi:hypothetical protein
VLGPGFGVGDVTGGAVPLEGAARRISGLATVTDYEPASRRPGTVVSQSMSDYLATNLITEVTAIGTTRPISTRVCHRGPADG